MAVKKKKAKPSALTSIDAVMASLNADIDAAVDDPDVLLQHTLPQEGNPRSLGPRVADPDKWADNMVNAAQAASGKWLENTLHPRKDPIVEAKKSNVRYKTAVQQSLQEDRYLKGLDNIDEAEMIATIERRGAAAFSAGIADRTGKIKKAIARIQPAVATLAVKLDAMPTDTREQREAKMIAAKRGMEEIGKARREGRL